MVLSHTRPGLPPHLSRLGSDVLRAGDSRARVRFLPDGTLLGVAGDLRRWSVSDERTLSIISGEAERLGACCVAPGGHIVAVVDEQAGDVVLLVLDSGVEIRRLPHDQAPRSLAWSPDGAWIASGGGGEGRHVARVVNVWDAATGAEAFQLRGPRSGISEIVFSADGELLAACGGKSVRLWEVRRSALGELKKPSKLLSFKHKEPVTRLLFSHAGDALITSAAHAVTCWDVQSNDELWTVERPGYASFTCLRWAGDRLLIAYGDALLLLDPSTGEVTTQWPGIWGGVADMDVSSDGGLAAASGSFSTRVVLFDLAQGRARPAPPGAAGWMHDIVPSPDGTSALTCSWDGLALLWELESGRLIQAFGRLDGTRRERPKGACFLSDQDLVIGYENHLQRWSVGHEAPLWERYFAHGWSLSLIAATADGGAVICCDEASRRTYGHATFYDARDGEVLASRRLYWTIAQAVTEPDCILLVGAKGAYTVAVETMEIVKETPFGRRWPSVQSALSADGVLWVGRANDIAADVASWVVLKTATGEVVKELSLGSEPADLDFGLEGRVIVTAHVEEQALRFWDPLAGSLLQEFDLSPIVPHSIRCVGGHVVIADHRGELVTTKLPDLSYTVPTKPKRIDYITECQRALQADPSPAAWQVLCLALDAWKELPDRVLEEAQTVLESWPDELRVAPDRWVDEVVDGRRQPRLRLVRTLRSSQVSPEGAEHLVACPDLDGLVEMELSMGPLGPDAAAAIADRFLDLKVLKLYAQQIGDDGARAIAEAPWTQMEVLRLGANKIGEVGALALVASSSLSGLKDLSIESNSFTPTPFVEAFLSATHLAGLERINLSGTKVRGVEVVADARHLSSLRAVLLNWLEVCDDDVARLADAPHLAGLEKLFLRGSRLGPDSVHVFGRASFADALKILDVDFSIDEDTIRHALSAYPSLEHAYECRHDLDIEELM